MFCFIHVHTTSEPVLMNRRHIYSFDSSQHITVSRLLISAALQSQNTVTTFWSKLTSDQYMTVSEFNNYYYYIMKIVNENHKNFETFAVTIKPNSSKSTLCVSAF